MNRLRDIRKARGMSQEVLATLSRLFQGRISELEIGKRQPTAAEKAALSAVLGVPPDKIFPSGLTPPPRRPEQARGL